MHVTQVVAVTRHMLSVAELGGKRSGLRQEQEENTRWRTKLNNRQVQQNAAPSKVCHTPCAVAHVHVPSQRKSVDFVAGLAPSEAGVAHAHAMVAETCLFAMF